LKWDKNKGTKGYLWLIVDDAGVVGVLWRDVRHWFIRVPSDGGLDRAVADAPAATLEEATGTWMAAADALAATLEVPIMGISFFSIAGGFLQGFFFGCGEDDGIGEAVAVRMRVGECRGRERGAL
jgi:hypothetical protein